MHHGKAVPVTVRILHANIPPAIMACVLCCNRCNVVYAATGYYPKGGPTKSNQEAQIDMIDESLRWAGINEANAVCSHCNLTASRHKLYKTALPEHLPSCIEWLCTSCMAAVV